MASTRKKRFKPYEFNYSGKKPHGFKSPQEEGEESISGTMAELESDDDVLMAVHEVGLALGEDYEHPRELNISADIEKAERYKRTH